MININYSLPCNVIEIYFRFNLVFIQIIMMKNNVFINDISYVYI